MKKFLVTGTPRSGTTFFCNTLAKEKDVLVPSFQNYELFYTTNRIAASDRIGISNYNEKDTLDRVSNYADLQNVDFLGFKTFNNLHYDNLNLIEENNLNIVIILRKNIWKILASYLQIIQNKRADVSSRLFNPWEYQSTPITDRFIKDSIDKLLHILHYSENVLQHHSKYITTIFFEDLVCQKNYTNESINNFFGRKLTFNGNYDDTAVPSDYITNVIEIKEAFVDPVLNSNLILEMPAWVKESLKNDCI